MLLPSPSGVERCAGYRCSMDRLGREDARILGLESPTIAGHTCKVVLAERPPDVGDVVAPTPAPGPPALLVAGARARAASAGAALRRLGRDLRAPAHLRRPSPRVLVRALSRRGGESPLDAPIGGQRRVAFVRASLEDFKRIRATAGEGTTVNDVVLAAVAGALRAWLRHRGIAAPRMMVKVPVSMHHGDEEPSAMGNRDSFFFADLPVAEPDAGRCLAAIAGETARRKREGDAGALYLFFSDLSHMSRAVERRGGRLAGRPPPLPLCAAHASRPPGPRAGLAWQRGAVLPPGA